MNGDRELFLIVSPYLILVLSAVLQSWREKRREYWIRKVNTYEHYYKWGSQIIDLLSIFDEKHEDWRKFWDLYFKFSEAYQDALFYDRKHVRRVQRMGKVGRRIWDIGRGKLVIGREELPKIREEIEEIFDEFKGEERL